MATGVAAGANGLSQTSAKPDQRAPILTIHDLNVQFTTPMGIVRAVEGLLSAAQLRIQNAEAVWLALQDYRDSTADFSDALIATLGKGAGCEHTLTFDRAAARHPAFTLLK